MVKNKKMKKEFEIDIILYPEDIVAQAISDFSEVWEIKYNFWKIEISWENEDDINEVFNELMNYIIWLINE